MAREGKVERGKRVEGQGFGKVADGKIGAVETVCEGHGAGRFLARNLRRLANGQPEAAVAEALADIGETLLAGRVCVFEPDPAGTVLDRTHEWCGEGVAPRCGSPRPLVPAAFPWLAGELGPGRAVAVPDIAGEGEGIPAIVAGLGGGLPGFLGVEGGLCAAGPCPAALDLVARFGELLGEAVRRCRESRDEVAFCRFGRDGTVLFATDPLGRCLGAPVGELVGSDVFALIPADRREEVRSGFLALDAECPVCTFRLRAPGGGRDQLWTGRALHAPDGGFLEYQLAVRDGGDTPAADSIPASPEPEMESVARLAGGMAHHFNNLLQAVVGYASLAMTELPAGSRAQADLGEACRAARRAADLVRRLLAFAGEEPSASRSLDLNVAVDGLLGELRRLAGDEISMDWRPGAELCPVRIDPGQLRTILAEVVANAREAAAGRIAIRTARAALPAGDGVLLSVGDDGGGMARETASRAFEPFFTTKDPGRSSGMGLPAVRGILRRNGGIVWLESEPGRGTEVRVFLPRADAPPA